MDVLWIILIAVLLGSLCVIWFVVRRWESRKPVEKPRQIVEAEKSEAADTDPEHIQPDIPVWRDKPKDQK